MIDIMKQGLGLRAPQQERFGNSQELKSFGGAFSTAAEPENLIPLGESQRTAPR